MLFTSIQYFIFFIVLYGLYYFSPHKIRWIILLLGSSFFYVYGSSKYIFLLIASAGIGYSTGLAIEYTEDEVRKKLVLIISVVLQLSILFVYKYIGLFSESINSLLNLLDVDKQIPTFKLLLPLGISFFTFQILSYCIDVYRGHVKPEKNFGYFFLFVSFFPQLLAGPIPRSESLLPQFKTRFTFNYEQTASGLRLILWGLFKKMVIADQLSQVVDRVYNSPDAYSGLTLIIATFFFVIQVYCDFSGYSDIAIGSAQIFGFTLAENFNRPYISRNFSEFWRRWHISLGSWIRDYLYNPLAINWRNWGIYGIALALIVTFILNGLWHGAAWHFVVFGFLLGIPLVWEIFTKKWRARIFSYLPTSVAGIIGILLTFGYWNFLCVFFRAPDLSTASKILLKSVNMIESSGLNPIVATDGVGKILFLFLIIIFLLAIEYLQKDKSFREMIAQKPRWFRALFYYTIISLIVFFGYGGKQEFIYFQF